MKQRQKIQGPHIQYRKSIQKGKYVAKNNKANNQ